MKKHDMVKTRREFLNKLFRMMLTAILAVIAFLLGDRVTYGQNCSECAGRGFCKGESDCSNYLHDAK